MYDIKLVFRGICAVRNHWKCQSITGGSKQFHPTFYRGFLWFQDGCPILQWGMLMQAMLLLATFGLYGLTEKTVQRKCLYHTYRLTAPPVYGTELKRFSFIFTNSMGYVYLGDTPKAS